MRIGVAPPVVAVAMFLVSDESTSSAVAPPVILAAGDIADCASAGDEATAGLLADGATILTLGGCSIANAAPPPPPPPPPRPACRGHLNAKRTSRLLGAGRFEVRAASARPVSFVLRAGALEELATGRALRVQLVASSADGRPGTARAVRLALRRTR